MKRFFTVGLALVALLAFAGHAQAGEAGHKGGFFIKNDDGSFKLRISGRMQPRLQFTKSNTDQKALTFSMRRALLSFRASVHEKISMGFALYHGSGSNDFRTMNITGATISYTVIPQFVVTAGMVGLPLDNLYSSGWSLLTEYPITATLFDSASALTVTRPEFGAPSGLGINFAGDIGKFFYSAGVVNAAESNYALNDDMKFSTGFQLGYHIMGAVGGSQTDFAYSDKPNLTVSVGGVFQGKRTDDALATAQDALPVPPVGGAVAPQIKNILTGSFGVGFRWKGLSAQSEWYYRRTKFNSFGTLPASLATDQSLDDVGYYASIGYYIIPKKLEVAAQAGQVFRQGPDNNGNQFGGGLNYYIKGNNLKLQTTYLWTESFSEIEGTRNNNQHLFVVQLQAGF